MLLCYMIFANVIYFVLTYNSIFQTIDFQINIILHLENPGWKWIKVEGGREETYSEQLLWSRHWFQLLCWWYPHNLSLSWFMYIFQMKKLRHIVLCNMVKVMQFWELELKQVFLMSKSLLFPLLCFPFLTCLQVRTFRVL